MRSQLLRIASFVALTSVVYLGAHTVLQLGPDAAAQRVESAPQQAPAQQAPAHKAEPANDQNTEKPKESVKRPMSPERREELSKCLEHRRQELREEKKARESKKNDESHKSDSN